MSRDPAALANRLPAAKADGDVHPGNDEHWLPEPLAAPAVGGRDEAGHASGYGSQRADAPETDEEARPRLELTATQIGAGVAAALTSAILGSGLGVAGTVAGAGVGSAISITASAFYSHSIAAARHRLRHARNAAPRPSGGGRRRAAIDLGAGRHGPGRSDVAATRSERRVRRMVPTRGLLVGALGMALTFVLALVLVTGIETVKGDPLAGGQPGGLSVLGGAPAGRAADRVPHTPGTRTSATTPTRSSVTTSATTPATTGSSATRTTASTATSNPQPATAAGESGTATRAPGGGGTTGTAGTGAPQTGTSQTGTATGVPTTGSPVTAAPTSTTGPTPDPGASPDAGMQTPTGAPTTSASPTPQGGAG